MAWRDKDDRGSDLSNLGSDISNALGAGGGPDPVYGYDPNQSNFQLPGYEGMSGQYNSFLGQGPRSAPQAGTSGFRGGQGDLARMLMSQARGHGPGQEIARMQAETQVDRGIGQQLAGARSARPGMGAMAARNAAMASGQLQGAGAQAATMGGLQAQQGAIGSLGNVLGQARTQDQSLAMGNAKLRHETMGLDDRRQMELLRQRLMMNNMQQQGNQAYEGSQQSKANTVYGYDAAKAQEPGWLEKGLGMAVGLGQSYMGMKAGQGGQGGGGYQPSNQQSVPGGMGGNGGNPYGGASNSYGLPDPGSGYQNPYDAGAAGQYSDENLYGTYTGGQ